MSLTNKIPLIPFKVPAGFPSPAHDFEEESIDLAGFLMGNPASSFVMRVAGLSMRDAGILDGDYIVVDRSILPRTGNIVVAIIEGDFTIKRLKEFSNEFYLCPENEDYTPMRCTENTRIWGVVIAVARKL